MVEIKDIKAIGNYVVLKMVVKEEDSEMYKQKKSGLYVPNQQEESPASVSTGKLELKHALVHDIGPDVENANFKIGDKVIFNEYDLKNVGSKENMFGITKAESIMAVYDEEEVLEEE